MGYTYFDIPGLTSYEVNELIEAYNSEQKEKEREYKRLKSKRK